MTARGIVVALALALGVAAGCGQITPEDIGAGGGGGTLARMDAGTPGTGGVIAVPGTGGDEAPGTGGWGIGGFMGTGGAPPGSEGGRGIGGGFHPGTGGTGTGGMPGAGGAASGTGGATPIPECNGTGRPSSTSLCGYIAPNGFEWVYMFKNGFRCVTCFSSPGVQQVTECLDSIDNPAALCVKSCADDCAY